MNLINANLINANLINANHLILHLNDWALEVAPDPAFNDDKNKEFTEYDLESVKYGTIQMAIKAIEDEIIEQCGDGNGVIVIDVGPIVKRLRYAIVEARMRYEYRELGAYEAVLRDILNCPRLPVFGKDKDD